MQSDRFTETDRQRFEMVNPTMDDVTAQRALKELGGYLETYYGRKVILFLDEYDTPMQEAYVGGYGDEFTAFIRSLFNSTFKTNPYLERAIMTGITRVSKDMSYPCQGYDLRPHQRASFFESIFSDLNNLKVITTTSNCYEQCFGFTEPEVFEALDSFGLSSQKQAVKQWYDGLSELLLLRSKNRWKTSWREKKSWLLLMNRLCLISWSKMNLLSGVF